MDALTLFGLLSVTGTLLTYALEQRSPWFILAFSLFCALGTAYGFLQGAWPFGVVEPIWALVALRRCGVSLPEISGPHGSLSREKCMAKTHGYCSERAFVPAPGSRQ